MIQRSRHPDNRYSNRAHKLQKHIEKEERGNVSLC